VIKAVIGYWFQQAQGLIMKTGSSFIFAANKKPPGLRREVNLEGLNRSENDLN
jgi:hypothetical protein